MFYCRTLIRKCFSWWEICNSIHFKAVTHLWIEHTQAWTSAMSMRVSRADFIPFTHIPILQAELWDTGGCCQYCVGPQLKSCFGCSFCVCVCVCQKIFSSLSGPWSLVLLSVVWPTYGTIWLLACVWHLSFHFWVYAQKQCFKIGVKRPTPLATGMTDGQWWHFHGHWTMVDIFTQICGSFSCSELCSCFIGAEALSPVSTHFV